MPLRGSEGEQRGRAGPRPLLLAFRGCGAPLSHRAPVGPGLRLGRKRFGGGEVLGGASR